MNKNTFILGIVAAFVAGGALGYMAAKIQYPAQNLSQVGNNNVPANAELRSISGTIKRVSGNTVTIEAQSSIYPFENLPTERKVVATDKTKIIKNEQKSPAVYQKEMEAYQAAVIKFQKAMQSPATGGATTTPATAPGANYPVPPSPLIVITLKVSELKAGNIVLIESDKNISKEISFEATTIAVMAAAAPTPDAPSQAKP